MNPSVSVAADTLYRSRDRATSILMIIAFALPYALELTVVAGVQAFIHRFQHPTNELMGEGYYLVMAGFAAVLTIVPILSMSAASARLGLARRARDLAVMRLIGLGPRQAKLATLIDTARLALIGMAVGSAVYLVTLPLWQWCSFHDSYLTVREMWVGIPLWVATMAITLAIVFASAWLAMRPLAITPLGVVRRTDANRISKKGIIVVAVFLALWLGPVQIVLRSSTAAAVSVGMLMLALMLALVNVVGVTVIAVGGRLMAAFARRPTTLIAARRICDDPRSQWRSYGAISLTGFIVATLLPLLNIDGIMNQADQQARILSHDISLGLMLVLAFVFVLGAVSTLVNQATRILDTAPHLRALIYAGAPRSTLNQARRAEILGPMILTVVAAFTLGLVFSAPTGASSGDPRSVLIALGLLLAGLILVTLAGEATRWWQNQVMAEAGRVSD